MHHYVCRIIGSGLVDDEVADPFRPAGTDGERAWSAVDLRVLGDEPDGWMVVSNPTPLAEGADVIAFDPATFRLLP